MEVPGFSDSAPTTGVYGQAFCVKVDFLEESEKEALAGH